MQNSSDYPWLDVEEAEREYDEKNPIIGYCAYCQRELRINEEHYINDDGECICSECVKGWAQNWTDYCEESEDK